MMWKSCAVGMRNAILRNYLKQSCYELESSKLNNRVFLLRNYWLIVALQKFDVLKTNICPRRANMLVLKWYYDENRIFPIQTILKHKQVDSMSRKMLFAVFKYLFSFQRYLSFWNMQISQLMTSYTQPDFVQIWWKEIYQPICIRNVWHFAARFY